MELYALMSAVHGSNTISSNNLTKKVEEYTAEVLDINLGDSSQTYRRKMRNIYKQDKKIKVYHGTSFKNAKKIATGGFHLSFDMAGTGVFVKNDLKLSVAYAREHKSGAIVESELYLKKGEYTRRGNTIIVHNPLLLVPLRIYKVDGQEDVEDLPMPPMLKRQR